MIGSVLKIRCTKRCHNYKDLWNSGETKTISGTAFPVKFEWLSHPQVIITNSHLVDESVLIEVTCDHTAYTATVIAFVNELDIAVLSVEDPKFWSQVSLFDVYDMYVPSANDRIQVFGYPDGGYVASITDGVVSRLTIKSVNYSVPQVLIQVDAAVNRGNSGGPVVHIESGKVIGVTSGNVIAAQNTSYVIPFRDISRVLHDYRQSKTRLNCYDLGAVIEPSDAGILRVTCTYNASQSAWAIGDVLIAVDGNRDIVSDHLKLMQYMRNTRKSGPIMVDIMRNGSPARIVAHLDMIPDKYLSYSSQHIDRRYYLFAGLDFMCVNLRYFQPLEKLYKLGNSHKIALYERYRDLYRTDKAKQSVILKRIFPTELTKPYQYQNLILRKINNRCITGMRDVYVECETPHVDREMITFTLEHPGTGELLNIDINHREALRSCESIAQLYIQKHYHSM
jgi:hypothetical protein